jgi:hypothetical protein
VQPAQAVQKAQDLELSRIVADQRLVQVQLVMDQGADQRPLAITVV